MNITKKFDRAFQWAGEKMGSEAKTSTTDDFKMLELEMALRFDGMDRLQKSMNAYVKWLGRRNETFEDKEKGLPGAYLGRTMVNHGEDFESDSEFGNCLIAMGRANETIAGMQEQFVADATTVWLESLDRSLAMMKDYQNARKKLENRRLALDASMAKMQKARRDDFRIEEEVRTAKAKYEETSEDVGRRMQDIKDAEADSVRDLTSLLDVELEFHERCADELRRTREMWTATNAGSSPSRGGYHNNQGHGSGAVAYPAERQAPVRSRSNTFQSLTERLSRTNTNGSNGRGDNSRSYDDHEPAPPVRMPIRSNAHAGGPNSAGPDMPTRPSLARSNTFQSGASVERAPMRSGASTPGGYSGGYSGGYQQQQAAASSPMAMSTNVGALRGQLRPVSRIVMRPDDNNNIFADRYDDDTSSSNGSPEWGTIAGGERSTSPATSYGSVSRSASTLGRKAPPPPPPSRSKKPAPPIPAKREVMY
ncbi:hypothetical protein RB598_004337 [Gaeumannomyces tritici]